MAYSRCFSSLGCPTLSLPEVGALAQRHAIDRIEVRALGGTVDLPKYFSEKFGTPAELAGLSPPGHPPVLALGASLALATAGPAEREQLLTWVPWAEALGARWLRVFDGGQSANAEEIAAAAATLHWWREQRARHGWRTDLMIETHDSLFTAAKVRRLLAVVPDAAILWDSHHTWRRGGEDPLATWTALRAHIVHVHVKDSASTAGGGFGYTLPGHGEFPFAALCAQLRADDFAGGVSLEWERLWHPGLGPLEDALVAAQALGW